MRTGETVQRPLSRRACFSLLCAVGFVVLALFGLRLHGSELAAVTGPDVVEAVSIDAASGTAASGSAVNGTAASSSAPGDTAVNGTATAGTATDGDHLDLATLCALALMATLLVMAVILRRIILPWRTPPAAVRSTGPPQASLDRRELRRLIEVFRI